MKNYLEAFLKEKPFFFALLRPKEVALYQPYKPFRGPVLDLGCGDGFFAEVAYGKVDAGIDVDREALKEAQGRKVYRTIKHYDGQVIPYPDSHFSTVVCNSVFEHIPNLGQVLKESSRVLKKGGLLLFTAPTDRWPEYLLGKKIIGDRYGRYFIKKSKHYNLFSAWKWQQQLARVGLEVVEQKFYLDNKKMMYLFDLSHYLSAPSLVTKKVAGRWVLIPGKSRLMGPIKKIVLGQTAKEAAKGPYLFMVARKMTGRA